MPEEDGDFTEFLRRVRAGDAQAAEELVRRYEPLIRREVRLKLQDPGLNRVFDSMDVCQSVLASFFVRAAAGQYDLSRPAQALGLLVRMARNKVAMAARRQRAQRRDGRRVADAGVEDIDPAGAAATPSRVVAARELLDRVRERLGDDERRLAEMRAQGREWSDIAAEMGGTADGRRMQLARALDRVVQELGIEEGLT
jgi:RNA polymerase sigma-70 factor (ECF subfamily)